MCIEATIDHMSVCVQKKIKMNIFLALGKKKHRKEIFVDKLHFDVRDIF